MRTLTRTLAAAAAVAVTLTGAGPAAATTGNGMPPGTGFGVPGATLPGLGTDSMLGSSLAQMDPLSQTMTMGALAGVTTADYTLTQDLANADMLAIDAAAMARSARLAEEARRAATATGRTGSGLKSGVIPARYEPLILAAVADYCPQLEPSILAAQIEAESNWNPRAQSPAGAQGIAQFMPATWTAYGVDGNSDGRKNVLDPADAIPAAARYDCAVRDTVRKVPGDPDANMLAGYNAGPGAVLKYRGIPPYAETRAYVDKILSRASDLADYDAGAGEAGNSAGCPTSAPAGTLRGAAARVGITRICADSVADARTPEAARAIKFTLRNLGVPYSQASRMSSGYFDCSSYVMRAYDSAGARVISGGWAPNTYYIETVPWAKKIAFTSRRPGDLVYPFPGHIAMSLAHDLKVHTNRPGDVSHVNDMYDSAYLTVRIDTSQV